MECAMLLAFLLHLYSLSVALCSRPSTYSLLDILGRIDLDADSDFHSSYTPGSSSFVKIMDRVLQCTLFFLDEVL